MYEISGYILAKIYYFQKFNVSFLVAIKLHLVQVLFYTYLPDD